MVTVRDVVTEPLYQVEKGIVGFCLYKVYEKN